MYSKVNYATYQNDSNLYRVFYRSLFVLNPTKKKARDIWGHLGSKFPNILRDVELDKLLTRELPMYGTLEDPEDGVSVDEWFAQLNQIQVLGLHVEVSQYYR